MERTCVTALYDAAQRGDYEAVQFLLSRGADAKAKNRTRMAMYFELFPTNSFETYCALNGMRTSNNNMIVQLAEEIFGVETQEEFVERRDAFDALRGPVVLRWPMVKMEKERMRRVESVLPKSCTKKSRAKNGHSGYSGRANGSENLEKRYTLRSRNPNLFYA